MRIRIFYCWLTGCILLLLGACNTYEKLLKSDDINTKLAKADEYFDRGDYHKASGLYESLLPVLKGTKNFERLYFRYAYSAFYRKDYLSASYHFKNFTDYFPSSKDAEEAMYMHVLCLYKESPKVSLEQTSTYKALEAMQAYINSYPESKRIAEANGYVEEMRRKLETKDASAAKLYYNIGHYKASGVAYRAVMQAYPDSPDMDYYQYMVVRSLYYYARSSSMTKQEERFANVVSEYQDLKDEFPASKYLADAEKYQAQATNQINKLRNEHQ